MPLREKSNRKPQDMPHIIGIGSYGKLALNTKSIDGLHRRKRDLNNGKGYKKNKKRSQPFKTSPRKKTINKQF